MEGGSVEGSFTTFLFVTDMSRPTSVKGANKAIRQRGHDRRVDTRRWSSSVIVQETTLDLGRAPWVSFFGMVVA